MSKEDLNEEQKEALTDALACLSELKEFELFPVKQKTIDVLSDLVGFVPRGKSDEVIKEPYRLMPEGTFSDSYMH